MDAMNIDQLRKAGLLQLGSSFLCVNTPPGLGIFTAGETYDSYSNGLLDDEGFCQSLSVSTFIPNNDDTNEPTGTDEDLVTNPSHYARFAIQPQEFILKNELLGHTANIVKYVCRAGHKIYHGKTAAESEVIDLQKAIDWAQERINLIEGNNQ